MIDYNAIALAEQAMQVPLDDAAMAALAARCQLHSGVRVLDLSCYRGHLLNMWAKAYDLRGTGVDERAECIDAAQSGADALNIWAQVQYVVDDVFAYPQPFHEYNVITWLTVGAGEDLPRWLAVMATALRGQRGMIGVGECFWRVRPSHAMLERRGIPRSALPDLGDLQQAGECAGLHLVDMLLLDERAWDSYYTQQWRRVAAWLSTHADHADVPLIREQWRASQRQYLAFERRAVGYGVFLYSPV